MCVDISPDNKEVSVTFIHTVNCRKIQQWLIFRNDAASHFTVVRIHHVRHF